MCVCAKLFDFRILQRFDDDKTCDLEFYDIFQNSLKNSKTSEERHQSFTLLNVLEFLCSRAKKTRYEIILRKLLNICIEGKGAMSSNHNLM